MIQFLVALVLFLSAAQVSAQAIVVRSGEHGSFTRLAFRLPDPKGGGLYAKDRSATIVVEAPGVVFDTTDIYRRISRDRIEAVRQDGAGAPLILDLACDIARQVLRQELQTPTGHLRGVIGEALELIVEDGLPSTVRMHPDDLVLMKDALEDTLGENAPEFVADVTITPGGCLIQTPSSTVDATIEKRWTRVVGNLGLDTAWDEDRHG